MTTLTSWFSADVTHALGWALIHSLWQCVGLAALAAVLMALSHRPSIRYLIGTAALVLMLAAPTATFLVLMKQAAPVHALPHLTQAPWIFAARAPADPAGAVSATSDVTPMATNKGTGIAPAASPTHILPRQLLSPVLLPPNILSSNILAGLVGAWLFGVALFSLRFAGGILLLEHKRRKLCRIPSGRILVLCLELQQQLGLDRAIRYLECGWIQVPAVIGWLRPIVLLPVEAVTGLTEAQLRAVIAHELAHIRRHDFFVNLLQVVVETLLFYHPAIWWLNRRIRAERELCCDEIAVSLTGNRLEYAKVLTLMAEWDQAPVLAMAANRGPLSERVFHVLGRKPIGAGRRMLGMTGSILFLAAALGAANALFGIAYPIPAAHANASLKAVLSSSRTAIDHVASPILQAMTPAVEATSPGQGSGTDATDQTAAANSQAEKLAVPLSDLAPQPVAEIPAAPASIASNDPLAAPAQPAADVSPAVALNGQPGTPEAAPVAAGLAAAAPAAAARSSCALPAIADQAKLAEIPGSNLMTVPVEINGKPKQFLLDLGMGPVEISEAAVSDLSLPENSRLASVIQTGGTGGTSNMGAQQAMQMQAPVYDVKGNQTAFPMRTRVRVGTFTIGGATARNMQFMVATDGEIAKGAPYDGLLTNDIFRQYDVELDFAAKEINFLTPAKCTDPDQVVFWSHFEIGVIPMTLVNGKIEVPVTIEGHPVNAVIDTTSARTVMRRDIAELTLGYKPGTQGTMPEGDVKDGRGETVYVHTFSRISFAGGVTAVNVPALIQTNSMLRDEDRQMMLGSRATSADTRIPDLTLGMDVLRQLHMYAVFGQKTLYVTANR